MKILSRTLANGKVAHAYLFGGPQGSGKRLAARLFAQALNCEKGQDPCGQCSACRRIARSLDPKETLHPDIMHLAPGMWEKQASHTILIDAVRDLCSRLYAAPLEARHRVVFVHEADTMQIAAQNAFLKTLEEPLERLRTVFVLVTDRPYSLLSTVRSRCQQIGFTQLSVRQAATVLAELDGLDPALAQRAALMADGNLELAREYAQEGADSDEDGGELAVWLELWDGLVSGKTRDSDTAIQKLTDGRDRVERVLSALLTWHRDLLLLAQGGDWSLVIHRDHLPMLTRQVQGLAPAQLVWRMDRLGEIRDFQNLYARGDLAFSALVQQILAGEDRRI